MTKLIALTGASGVLGRHIAFLLAKKKIRTIATSRTKMPFKNKYVKWEKFDLYKKFSHKILDKKFKNSDVLIHAGAHVPINSNIQNINKITKTNIDATYTLYNWAKKNNVHFIFLSGAIVYKKTRGKIKENSNFLTKKENIFYGYAKKICDVFFLKKIKKREKITILRPTSIYGWGMKKNKIITKILNSSTKKKNIKLYKPFNKINFIHAKDVADAIYKCIKKKKYGCFNLSYPKMYTIHDLAKVSNKIYINKKSINIIEHVKSKKQNYSLDISSNLAYKILGWRAKVNLRKGLNLIKFKKCF